MIKYNFYDEKHQKDAKKVYESRESILVLFCQTNLLGISRDKLKAF